MSSLQTAVELFRQGRFLEAQQLCERLLTGGERPSALMLMADLHLSAGRHAEAVPLLEELRRLHPLDAANARRLGSALMSSGQVAEGIRVLVAAVGLEPANVRGHNQLGQALLGAGEAKEAVVHFERAIALDANYAIGFNNLGLGLNALGRAPEALRAFERCVSLDPTLLPAWFNLGCALRKAGRFEQALIAIDRVLAGQPANANAWSNRAALLAKLDRHEEGLSAIDQALKLVPHDPVFLAQRAWFLLAAERYEECLALAEAALKLKPDYAEGLNLKGAALCKLHKPEIALSVINRALALEPGYVDALCTRALTLIGLGDHDEATASFRQALSLDPDCIAARAGIVAAGIPAVPPTPETDTASREILDRELSDFERWLALRPSSQRELLQLAQQQLFYLSYQEQDNHPWLARYRGAIAARVASPHATVRAAPQARRRIGIVSAHVYDHSVFVALTLGWLKHLDRAQFEITLVSLAKKKDALTRSAQPLVDHLESDRGGAESWARCIADLDLEALIYPEVGMDPTTMSLAHLRLAPLQLAAWGHPETTGLPTMDGYLSAEAFEPEGAQAHYGESLWALPHLGVAYTPQPDPDVPLDLEALGVDPQVPLFVCAGTPFTYPPDNDPVLARIAQRVGACQFLFFDYERRGLSQRLHARLTRCFLDHGLDPKLHLKQLPWLPRGQFLALLRQAHVFLDTLGFSGFNTQMLALQAHTPSVAFESRYLRGRLASGILRHVGLEELVVRDREQYVELASRLGTDEQYRRRVGGLLKDAEPKAYDDPVPVRALERILVEQVRPR